MPKPTKRSSGKPKRDKQAPAEPKRAKQAPPKRDARRTRGAARPDVTAADPGLFAPLTEGERADALRTLLEDERMRETAKVGRYRVAGIEPLVVKPPEPLAGRRLARVVIYDYAGDRCIDACVDLDRGAVCHAAATTAQPVLSRDEEAAAIAIATRDERLAGTAQFLKALGVMHYWSRQAADLAFRRRSAAVIFGGPEGAPKLVAVVDLIDGAVTEVVRAEQW
jgi:hypothetical protein